MEYILDTWADGSLDAEERRPSEHQIVGDAVVPTDAKYSSGFRLLEPLLTYDVSMKI